MEKNHPTQPASTETPPSKTETLPTPAHPVPRFLSKKGALLGLFFVFLLVFVLSISTFMDFQKQNKKGSVVSSITPTPTISAKATQSATANWETYANAKYGFTFKYPRENGLVLTENFVSGLERGIKYLDRILIAVPNSDQLIALVIYPNPNYLPAQQWWELNFNELYKGVKDHIDGKPINKIDFKPSLKTFGNNKYFYPEYGKFQGVSFFVENKSYVIEIASTLSETEQILQTFTFD